MVTNWLPGLITTNSNWTFYKSDLKLRLVTIDNGLISWAGCCRLCIIVLSLHVLWHYLFEYSISHTNSFQTINQIKIEIKSEGIYEFMNVKQLTIIFPPFFSRWNWVWTQGFILAKQVLYNLSHISSLLYSGYFSYGVLQTVPQLPSNRYPPNLSLPSSKDYRLEPRMPG
jgi:hypothetical protein